MKNLFLMMVVLLTFSVTAQAQRKGISSSERAEKMITTLEKEHSLNSTKAEKLKEVLVDYFENIKGDRKNRAEFIEERDKEVKKLLSNEEYEAYLKLANSRNSEKRNGKRGGKKN